MAYNGLTLQPAGVLSASGAGAWMPVPTQSMIAAMVDITAGTSSPVFDLWLQGTNDSTDSTGYDVPADHVLKDSGGLAAANTATANVRDIVDNKTTTTAERFTGIYEVWPYKYVRVRWTLTGGTITGGVTAGVK